ncbi:hypothetical protein CYLTODRAFT_417559 [Cylindrobasidium torrendii FP15055 ss-10]|uniref:GYF domain-containing protein n=1 Tax=Cylindrobasidium torrendii FP15055 ss-10 TaxID=1314674 RepID=A0A0D7BQH2_9AGAR|nr:hypothetical protein CYLTODRAFT_417559 [Cylindrobasidium torrendii FP15055 ss-10]
MPHLIEDDQSSDALDAYEDEHYDDLPRGIQQVDLNNKTISIAPGQDKSGDEVVTGNRSSSISNDADTNADAASARSVPALTVSQASPQPSEMHPGRVESPPGTISSVPPPSPSRSHHSTRPSVASTESRRRRSNTLENNRPNRLSGFFNNFIHRRDHGSPDLPIREEAADKDKTETYSRPETPPPRPGTPPPELAPPSLKELGLSLNVLTSNLSPAHFTTPPTSGAFLAPHYLLLCHAQGLDVLPLVSPPAAQPYALVRRVCFKSVVVMEQRGVLVAIAGRRDGVRVYALEEVKRAVEWRIDVEVRREREKQRREGTRRLPSLGSSRNNVEKPQPVEQHAKSPSQSSFPPETSPPTTSPPMIPRTPTVRRAKSRPSVPPVPVPPPTGHPPPYSAEDNGLSHPAPPTLGPPSMRTRGLSVSEVLTGPSRHYTSNFSDPDAKAEPLESSDDEAINIVAAGASGSEALDERTSSTSPASSPVGRRTSHSISRTNRPANLDLSLSRTDMIPQPEPSPAPTLLTLRQALSHSPSRERPDPSDLDLATPDMDADNDFDDEQEAPGISLSQMLQESRLPNLPPPGTRQTQQPIIIAGGTVNQEEVASPRSSDVTSNYYTDSETLTASANRRRRWSNIIGQGSATNVSTPAPATPSAPPSSATQARNVLQRSSSFRSRDRSASAGHLQRPSTAPGNNRPEPQVLPPVPGPAPSIVSATSSRSSRFIPRLLTAFQNRRSEDRTAPPARNSEADSSRRTLGSPLAAQTPPPKLEYVKLPGTKGALLVKAVETAKKSFLAILCGDNGEKVELFAGTYRTALGLSRTFILPDSPRSLELQLQGDDLVEVFLVFSQNVFGLEPATVRVREVRIGRAERRAARRRAREARAAEGGEGADDEPNASVSIGVSVSVGSTVVATGTGPDGTQTPPLIAAEHPNQPSESTALDSSSLNRPATPGDPTTTTVHPEDIAALSGSHMGPYTTFQQLTFAPQFPLASIADDYVIPPTYPDFIDYRNEHEPDNTGSDLAQVQFSPPGLPVPVPSAPSKWFYKDPKSVVHGPWKAALMQAWYKDGLLPPDLPVRREEDDDFTLLKDLRLQSVDPAHPFRASPANPQLEPPSIFQPSDKPFLKPISLLAQPRHFGPPALFFSSRGGHSTTIVDNRGRSVLKGRFMWTKDEEDVKAPSFGRMGDVKRLEAFDIRDRAVLVAMRQGGLEVVDLSDALLKPADESRTALPQFNPPASSYNRRGPYVWKMGMPISGGSTLPPSKGKSSLSPLPSKRTNASASRSPSGKIEFGPGSSESEMQDEVLFLGRKADQLFICERNAGAFRILRLSPS